MRGLDGRPETGQPLCRIADRFRHADLLSLQKVDQQCGFAPQFRNIQPVEHAIGRAQFFPVRLKDRIGQTDSVPRVP